MVKPIVATGKEFWKLFIVSILATAVLIFLGGVLTSIIWNVLITYVFGLPAIDLVQGVALIGLIWIIRGVIKD